MASPTEPLSYGRTWLQQCGRLLRRPTFWRDAKTPASLPGRTHKTSTSISLACSGNSLTKTIFPIRRRLSPLSLSWHPQQHLTPPASSPCAPPILSRLPCYSVCALVNTPKNNHTGDPFRSDSVTYNFMTKLTLLHKAPWKNSSFAPCAVTILLYNQKNCVRGESTTMEATNPEHRNPVSSTLT